MTNRYNKILVAIDLNPEHDNYVLEKALKLSDGQTDAICIAHAVQHVSTYSSASAYHAIADIENQITEEHKQELATFASQHNIHNDHMYVVTGSPNTVIPDLAKELGADIIVVGSHSHHGLGLLSKPVADSLLHHTDCDVLAVKLLD